MPLLGVKFIVAAAIVVFAGYRICIYADKIAQTLKIGRTFVGLILLAVVTSLPELAVALSATKIGALDLALGDLFGSNLFNLTIVAVIFFILAKQPKKLSFDYTHFISLGFSLLLVSLAALGIVFYNFFNPQISYSNIFLDLETILIFTSYILGIYLIFRVEKTTTAVGGSSREKSSIKIWLKFIAFSAILVASAIYLAQLGDQIARIPV
ncbi:MAG: hypothetical protein HQ595_03305, partial [Candidatus Omnitrophica bacterium]|nr:hypothetical protein [Candidatus Omnitrophota bacterium]